jgi:L-gulonolactone oxidase
VDLPNFALNKTTVGAFNAVYYWNGRRKAGRATIDYGRFFYPLDAIRYWNRFYGQRGMYQYQSVVPPETAHDATSAMLKSISTSGEGSFLAVLKTFGNKQSPGLLSFPKLGTTLALDFPNRGASTLALMDRLDAIVSEAGGRLYPAKDGRIPAPMFREGYPQWEAFRHHVDPQFSSHFWARVGN